MGNPFLEKVSIDLLSILPLIIRSTHRKLLKPTLADIDVNITPLHFEIIRLIDDEGPSHAKIIAERLQIAKAQMTQLINKLVEMKLVQRETDPVDRRNMIISMTDYGHTILNEYRHTILHNIQETLSCLSEAELKELSLSVKNLQTLLIRLP
ncbi:MAG TPA: MarR family transcriptional regulator [Dehalococcoidales bacterium]|nr:MarR family transcriptional regulator [Dehalococcoidales bacterium]